MGVHTHGPVSTATKRLIDDLSTDELWDRCLELGIDTTDYPDSDDYDYLRQKVIDHFAALAGER